MLVILNAWCMKMFLSGYGNMMASSYGFTKFFAATLCLVGFCKITFKLDSYMASLGVNLGRPAPGMGAAGAMLAASRIISQVARTASGSGGTGDVGGTRTDMGSSDGMTTNFTGPIPMTPNGGNAMDINDMTSDGDFDALIVGQNIKVLLKLLESDGGIKKDLFRPDDIYDQYYYIPMCREGILQIVLLTEKRKREKLKQSLFSRFSIKREKEYATYNVCDENGNPIYLVYDLEMRQLCRIKQELLWRPSVSIVCMDYQAETIREYLGEKVIIYELNAENVMKYLINDLGE